MQNDPEIVDDWLNQVIRNRLIDTHTALPAVIDSFDSGTQTAKVNLCIKRMLKDGSSIQIPPVINVPVVFPSGGGYSITFPVSSGDECLIVFAERSIENWLISGGVQEPSDKRMHSYNDAFAIMGGRSLQNSLSSYETSGLQIRNNSGTNYINVTSDEIEVAVGSLGGATFSEDGSVTFKNGASVTADGRFVDAFGIDSSVHTHGGVTSGTSSTGVAQ